MRARLLKSLGAVLIAAMPFLGSPAAGAEFAHDAHNRDAEIKDCTKCHEAGAKSIVPQKGACLACHKEEEMAGRTWGKLKTHGPFWMQEHERYAEASGARCDACHEQKFCVQCHRGDPKIDRPKTHLADFLELHPIRASANRDTCTKCHETSFCADCHNKFRGQDLALKSHRRGWSDISAGGVNHETRFRGDPNSCDVCHPGGLLTKHQWTDDHAREARRNLTSCQSCHPNGDVCKKCHSAVQGLKANPHPKNWNSNHKRLAKASDERSCRACHLSKNSDPTCRRCH